MSLHIGCATLSPLFLFSVAALHMGTTWSHQRLALAILSMYLLTQVMAQSLASGTACRVSALYCFFIFLRILTSMAVFPSALHLAFMV